MRRLYAVGDIHGCAAELNQLLAAIPVASDDTVVFIGDYVDRGPSSRDVLSCLTAFSREKPCQTVFLKGNHEDMFLSYMGMKGQYGEMFLYNGGVTTLASYGIAPETKPVLIAEMLPEDHVDFLLDLRLYFEMDDWLFVHAGIHPLFSLAEQKEEDLLWIRGEFISNPHRMAKTVVFGHTPQKEILWNLPYKVGIDTGVVYGNKLTCLELNGRVVYEITRGERCVKARGVTEAFEQRAEDSTRFWTDTL